MFTNTFNLWLTDLRTPNFYDPIQIKDILKFISQLKIISVN